MLVIINTKVFFYFYHLWITIFIVFFPFIQLSLINSHLVACFATLRILSATRKNRRYQRIEGKKKKKEKKIRPRGGNERKTRSSRWIARARNLIRDVTSSLSRKLPPRRRYRLVDKDNEAGQWAAGPRIVLNKSRFSTVGPPIIDVNDDDCLSIPNPWI